MRPPQQGDVWVALLPEALPVAAAEAWAVRPGCGAVVAFTGTTRDHSGVRRGVTRLEYEAYEDEAVARLDQIAAAARRRWPELGRVVLWHRVGAVEVGQAAVAVVVSAPHRGEAFEACRFGIDAVKATVPLWKLETWPGGESWGLEAQALVSMADWERTWSSGSPGSSGSVAVAGVASEVAP